MVHASQLKVTLLVDKGSTTPLLLGTKIEQVQTEHEKEPQQVSIDEVSEKGQIGEQPQQTSQDTEVRTVGSTDTKTVGKEPSQREKTLERSDKCKSIAIQTPSSSKGKSPVQHIPRLHKKNVIRNKKQQFTTKEEDIMELIEVLRKLY